MGAALIFLGGFFALVITPGLVAQHLEARKAKQAETIEGA